MSLISPAAAARLAALLLFIPISACSDTSSPNTSPLDGTWAGDRVNAHFNARGLVLDYDCAKGLINSPIALDLSGRFAARGTHEAYRPGPDRVDQASSFKQAAYMGAVVDNILTLTVQIEDEPVPRTYRLEKNKKVKLARCL